MSSGTHQGQVAGTRWDPNLYLKFSDHRLRPGLELLDRVPLPSPAVIYDLGCGSGHLTRLIAERWPAASVCGVDNSRDMLAEAAAEPGRVQWVEADVHQHRASRHSLGDNPTPAGRGPEMGRRCGGLL
jgi:trans-aconitate 2-methyltransferase